ncbi:MAG: hypothetical protein LBD63_01265 [Mycoplasmataceae bacterium]|jgi:RNase H-fold protein (predicted Holliday junction resolvase)|nr:hypothetical protein [Mycoplasmataceae bacterium]
MPKETKINAKKILRHQYFLDLKSLQTKYDKLLAQEEEKQRKTPLRVVKIDQSDNYNFYFDELHKLTNDYYNERNKLVILLKKVRRDKNHEQTIDTKKNLKEIKKQFKLDKRAIRHKYYLQTIDSIHSSYIQERDLLTKTYRQKLANI